MPAGAQRDRLSIRYDPAVRRVLLAAIRAHKVDPKRPRAAKVFVASPIAEFRHLDPGGRTDSERAFTRAVYYQTDKVPLRMGVPKTWAAKLTWGKIERRGRRFGRQLKVRLFLASSGSRFIERNRSRSWQEAGERSYVALGGAMPEQWMRQQRRRTG